MDPNAALKELLELAQVEAENGARWAELVLGLHEWITRGGFLPTAWKRIED